MAHNDHASEHEHGHLHSHEHEHAPTATAGTLPDLAKVAILINNWIDHNEGHRRTYLEWRDKLAEAGAPATVAALTRIAELTEEATAALRVAARELQEARPPKS